MKVQLVLTLIWDIFETISYAGVFVGWAAINPILVSEGYFAGDCNNTDTNNGTDLCQSQTEQLNLVYTITASLGSILCLPNGVLLDRYGSWVARTAMLTIISLGNALGAISDPIYSPWLLFICFPFIYVGGYGLANINLGVSNLYPKFEASVVSLITGAFDSAAVVYLLVEQLYGLGVPLKAVFIFYTCISVFYHANTFILNPRYAVPSSPTANYVYGYKELSCYRDKINTNKGSDPSNTEATDDPGVEGHPLKIYLKKFYTWTNTAHFCVFHFSLNFFIGSFNHWISVKVGSSNEEMISHFTTMFVTTQCLAVVFSPVSGFVNDYFRRRFIRKKLSSKTANMKAVAMSLLIGDSLIILLFMFTLVPNNELQYVTMILQVIGRSFMYSTSASFISVGYPSRHLGVLYSLMECIAGFILLLQFPTTLLVTRVFDNNFDYIYGFILCLCILALFHPLYLLHYVRKSANPVAEKPISYTNPIFTSTL